MKKENTTQRFKDISCFTRWVNDFDAKDKSLTSRKRKRKWILITGGIFVLFLLSFLLFRSSKPETSQIILPAAGKENDIKKPAGRSAGVLPVDSFENHLKSIIREELSEKQ
ncbi:hypothetical protein [Maribellus maritimus]|uniref:hypothetical protein n=1 Tax=Maribellus maritimus TaxID=2870838 RepID=UPI001EEC2EC3|nr:hypothetical protein [Maribellus maritimus]MCG6190854.1 hypothetical protein [Maribellus maritimus]